MYVIFCELICLLYSCPNEYIYLEIQEELSEHKCIIPKQQKKFTQPLKKRPNW